MDVANFDQRFRQVRQESYSLEMKFSDFFGKENRDYTVLVPRQLSVIKVHYRPSRSKDNLSKWFNVANVKREVSIVCSLPLGYRLGPTRAALHLREHVKPANSNGFCETLFNLLLPGRESPMPPSFPATTFEILGSGFSSRLPGYTTDSPLLLPFYRYSLFASCADPMPDDAEGGP